MADEDQSARFYIIDRTLDGFKKWKDWRPNDFTIPVDIRLCDSATGYLTGTNCIYVDTSDNDDDFRPDTYDGDVIIEEYGHKISRDFFFFDAGSEGSHWWFTNLDPYNAATEGFSYLWSFIVRNSNTLTNRWDNFSKYRIADAEDGSFIENGQNFGSANDSGNACEGAVACILWDIFDNGIDDYNGDGIGDIFNGGENEMLDAMVTGQPNNLEEFWNSWFSNGYGYHHEMWAIWWEHAITSKDSIPPAGSFTINNGYPNTTNLLNKLSFNYTDTLSGILPPVGGVNLSNSSNGPWTGWLPYVDSHPNWDLSEFGGNTEFGVKTVYLKVRDCAGNEIFHTKQIEYVECLPGDANGDGSVNVADPVYLLDYIFEPNTPAPTPYPIASGDANGDCSADVGDVVWMISYIFKSGPAPVDCNTWVANCGLPIRK